MTGLNAVLSAAELKHLGTLTGGRSSAISPLAGPADGPVDPARLAQIGLLAPGGALAPSAADAVNVLANARAYAALIIQDATAFEHVVYFSGHEKVALTNEAGDFRLQDPPPALGDLLRVKLGEGVVLGLALDEELSAAEAAVLFAAVDLRRRQRLEALLEDRDVAALPIDPSSVASWLARPLASSQWLAPILRGSVEAPVDRASMDEAFRSLSARGALAAGGSGVVAGPMVEALGSHFLVIRMLLRLRAGRVADDGRVISTDIRVAQSAGFQHLLWEADGAGRVHVQCVTPTGLATTIERFLTDADALAEFVPAPPAPVAAPRPKQTTQAATPASKAASIAGPKGDLAASKPADAPQGALEMTRQRSKR